MDADAEFADRNFHIPPLSGVALADVMPAEGVVPTRSGSTDFQRQWHFSTDFVHSNIKRFSFMSACWFSKTITGSGRKKFVSCQLCGARVSPLTSSGSNSTSEINVTMRPFNEILFFTFPWRPRACLSVEGKVGPKFLINKWL